MSPTTSLSDSVPTEMLILAGGLGTRLRPVVSDVPKPMAPIGGVPFLDYLMAHWRGQGITRFVLSVGYMADSIRWYFGNRYHDCAIDYAAESSPLGTGGAVRNAITNLPWSGDHLAIINGDTWFPVSLRILATDAHGKGKPVTVAVKRIAENNRYGGIVLDENGLIRQFTAVSMETANPLINGGTYLINRNCMADLMRDRLGPFSFEREILEPLGAAGLLAASVQDVQFLDIGVPDDYQRANELLSRATRDTIEQPRPY
jgi:D-glycero-alpha-D-manno-heptose 1-phosphate guanylyltransferase